MPFPPRAAEHRACGREGARALDKVFKERTPRDTGAYSGSSTPGEEGRYWRYWSPPRGLRAQGGTRASCVGQPRQLPKDFGLTGTDAHRPATPGDPRGGRRSSTAGFTASARKAPASPGIQLTLPRFIVAILGLSRSTAWMQILYPCKDSPETEHRRGLLSHRPLPEPPSRCHTPE